jgi:hypothetical protein
VGQIRSGSVGLDFQKGNLRDRFRVLVFSPSKIADPRSPRAALLRAAYAPGRFSFFEARKPSVVACFSHM